jgi:hypothetical protein
MVRPSRLVGTKLRRGSCISMLSMIDRRLSWRRSWFGWPRTRCSRKADVPPCCAGRRPGSWCRSESVRSQPSPLASPVHAPAPHRVGRVNENAAKPSYGTLRLECQAGGRPAARTTSQRSRRHSAPASPRTCPERLPCPTRSSAASTPPGVPVLTEFSSMNPARRKRR